jgi:hypothetical protein
MKVVDGNGKSTNGGDELRRIGIVVTSPGKATIGMGAMRALVPPGDLFISFSGIPQNYSIKSVVAGNADLTKNPLHVDFSPTPVEIQLTLERKK